MDRGTVERIVAVVDAQEARGLLEGLVAEARHLAQFFAIRERAVGIAVLDDVFRQHRVQPRHAREQRRRSRIDVHAHRVDAVFDRGVERARERALVHVVLILADADRLGIDLHQLGQRILQAPGDGHGAAQAHVQLGKFGGGECRRRIDRGAGFADDDFVHFPVPASSTAISLITSAASLSVSRLAVPLPMEISSTPCCTVMRASVASDPCQSLRGWCG